MDWQERIHTDPEILVGKPVIKGTRLAVEFLLERLANGWTEQQLSREDIHAVYAYVYDCMQDGLLIAKPRKSA